MSERKTDYFGRITTWKNNYFFSLTNKAIKSRKLVPKAFKIFIVVFGHSAVYKRIIVVHVSAFFLYNRGFHNECKVEYVANVGIGAEKILWCDSIW